MITQRRRSTRQLTQALDTIEDEGKSQQKNAYKSYLEFQTQLFTLVKKTRESNCSSKQAFIELTKAENLFDQQNSLVLLWPQASGVREVTLRHDGCDVISFSDEKEFLAIQLTEQHVLTVLTSKNTVHWQEADRQGLIELFCELLRIKEIRFANHKDVISIARNSSALVTKESLNEMTTHYQFYPINYRINHVLLLNAKMRNLDGSFHLSWPTQVGTSDLVVNFSRDDLFYTPVKVNSGYSWVMTEDTLLNSFAEYQPYAILPGQFYYSLKVYEELETSTTKNLLMEMWLTPDAWFAELHTLHKGKNVSGNEVLSIYQHFDHLFKPKKTFLCDDSKLTNEDETIRVPLRLILPLVSNKTWYESKLKNLSLFECKEFQSSHNGLVTQNSNVRQQAIGELQSLLLKDWYEMLNQDEKIILLQLYRDYFDKSLPVRKSLRRSEEQENPLMSSMTSLRELVTVVYDKAKQTQKLTKDLHALSDLLCKGLGVYHMDNAFDPKQSDCWVKERVNVLLWGSYFWVKQADENKGHPKLRSC